MEHRTRDGVKLAFAETGSGSPPIVLVHGWTCNHTYFAPQRDHWAKRHRVVSVDLRGHGQSDKPKGPYTIAGFADDVAWLCRELGLEKPVVVGHSMGGMTAIELAARHPELPSAIVACDSPAAVPAQLANTMGAVTAEFRKPDWRTGRFSPTRCSDRPTTPSARHKFSPT
jgi:pimeloyl-ACP methyl ester carboxylesterase